MMYTVIFVPLQVYGMFGFATHICLFCDISNIWSMKRLSFIHVPVNQIKLIQINRSAASDQIFRCISTENAKSSYLNNKTID